MPVEITEEEIFDNDKDPLEAIREIRRAEGVAEENLPDPDDRPISDVADMHDAAEDDQPVQEEEDDTPAEENQPQDAQDDGEEADSDQPASDEEDSEEKAETKKDSGPVGQKFKANGQEFEFSEEEIIQQFPTVFGQAMNYTQKMQAIAPYRKMISALEQEGITHDSLNIAIDALKGDVGAIRKLMDQNKIDPYDLTSDDDQSAKDYTPKNYGKDQTVLDIEEITSTIRNDEEFRITTDVIDNQWDDNSRRAFASNPDLIVALHNDIKTGLYDSVAPAAMKMKVLDGNSKSDIEYYMLAGRQVTQKQNVQNGQKKADELNKEAQDADSKFDKESSTAAKKRSASSTGARADRKGVIDYLDDDDEAYEEWRKNLDASI
jgi:hypothetical protein